MMCVSDMELAGRQAAHAEATNDFSGYDTGRLGRMRWWVRSFDQEFNASLGDKGVHVFDPSSS